MFINSAVISTRKLISKANIYIWRYIHGGNVRIMVRCLVTSYTFVHAAPIFRVDPDNLESSVACILVTRQ
jgi:hypothetical protein